MRLFRLIQDIIPVAIPDSVPDVKQELGMLRSLPIDELLDRMVSGIVTLAINLALAILVFYIGKFVIRKIYNIVRRILLTRRVDSGLRTFLLSMVNIVLYFILVVTCIGILGIETSSFLAIFASAGVAIGMALSGTLQNFAGGVLILLLKPYRIGDYIEAQGYAGTVKEIQIFHTVITTYDNKSIIIPNGGLSTGSVNNWSRESYRRVDWSIAISYGDDVDVARSAIMAILDADKRIVNEPTVDNPVPGAPDGIKAPAKDQDDHEQTSAETADDNQDAAKPKFMLRRLFRRHHNQVNRRIAAIREARAIVEMAKPYSNASVVVNELADSAVVLKVRAWTKTGDYWSVFYDVNEQIYKQLPKAGIHFPFPQIDVHLDPVVLSSQNANNTPS
ncbi:MAG: mechanosensitive ion channel [Bacteroidales bacterium]|nr:mechanosensitive ion channel [Bacteroidales bacterium]